MNEQSVDPRAAAAPAWLTGVDLPRPAASWDRWEHFRERLGDRDARARDYAELVSQYYELVTKTYLEWGGSSFHFASPRPGEAPGEAVARLDAQVAASARIGPSSRVLDVGCGVGGPAVLLARLTGARVVGLNISRHQLEVCRALAEREGVAERVELVEGDYMDLPFEDESFDAVVFFESSCHAPDKAGFVQSCARVLRPGGRLAGTDWVWGRRPEGEELVALAEWVCRYHAVPDLGTLGSYCAAMEGAGLRVLEAVDLAAEGDFLRNWDDVDPAAAADGVDPTTALVVQGALALRRAAYAGLFRVARFTAERPRP